jgi:hypothetical protein
MMGAPGARAARLLAASLCIALAGCSDGTGPAPLPEVIDVAVLPSDDPPHTSLAVTLDQPGAVQVTYWRAADETALQVTTDGAARTHEVFLPRLYPVSEYFFEARALAPPGPVSAPVTGSFVTGALPAEVAALQFAAQGAPTDSLALIEVMLSSTGFGGGAIIVDADGRIVWYWKGQGGLFMGSTRRANGNWVFHDAGRLVELTPGRRMVAELPNAGPATPYGTIHHDVTRSPQNTLYFIANDVGQFGDSTLVGEAIWEWLPEQNRAEKRWSVFDFLSWPEDMGPESVLSNWMHMNSLAVGLRGNVLYSARSMDQVVSIAPDFSAVEWRLNGVNATIPLAGDLQFSGQHNISEVGPDRILMWDNGRRRPDGVSRALELQLNPAGGTATKVAEYRGVPDRLQPIVGGAFRMASGNTLVTYGFGGGDQINIYEVGAGGAIHWHLVAPPGVGRVYKAHTLESIAGEQKVPLP